MVTAFRHIMTITGLHLDMTDILEVEGHPALDDVGPVEADVVGMMTGSAFDGFLAVITCAKVAPLVASPNSKSRYSKYSRNPGSDLVFLAT